MHRECAPRLTSQHALPLLARLCRGAAPERALQPALPLVLLGARARRRRRWHRRPGPCSLSRRRGRRTLCTRLAWRLALRLLCLMLAGPCSGHVCWPGATPRWLASRQRPQQHVPQLQRGAQAGSAPAAAPHAVVGQGPRGRLHRIVAVVGVLQVLRQALDVPERAPAGQAPPLACVMRRRRGGEPAHAARPPPALT